MSLSIPLLPLRRASSFRRLRLLLHSSLALTLPFSFLFICQFLPASRVTPCAQVFPALLFRVVPNRTGRFRFATGTLLPTQRDQLFIVTIHAQIPVIHCLTPHPTPGRLIASARDARVRRNRRAFAIVTSMAQTDSSFDAGVVPTRGRLLASTRTADFILEFRQFFVIALATQALALYHFRPVPAPVGFSAVAHRALFIRQHDLLGSVTRLTDIRALNDFTLFPSNVCVVPMLAFFVYARFFLPNTRRRSHIGPTRRWCFRHSIEREDEEEEEEEIRIDEREREREKGEEPLFHV